MPKQKMAEMHVHSSMDLKQKQKTHQAFELLIKIESLYAIYSQHLMHIDAQEKCTLIRAQSL